MSDIFVQEINLNGGKSVCG